MPPIWMLPTGTPSGIAYTPIMTTGTGREVLTPTWNPRRPSGLVVIVNVILPPEWAISRKSWSIVIRAFYVALSGAAYR